MRRATLDALRYYELCVYIYISCYRCSFKYSYALTTFNNFSLSYMPVSQVGLMLQDNSNRNASCVPKWSWIHVTTSLRKKAVIISLTVLFKSSQPLRGPPLAFTDSMFINSEMRRCASYLPLASSCRICSRCGAEDAWSSHILVWWLLPLQWQY